MDKLTWFNFEYIRQLPFEEYLKLATPWFDKALGGLNIDYRRLGELMQGRTEVFNRVPDMVAFLKEMPEYDLELYTHKKMKTTPETSLEALRFIKPTLEGIGDWQETAIHDALMGAIAEAGRKNGAVLWPLRIALSGLASTPGGAVEIAYLLGKEETLKRVDAAIARLQA
jgi:glutamyl-tRNA synthetase